MELRQEVERLRVDADLRTFRLLELEQELEGSRASTHKAELEVGKARHDVWLLRQGHSKLELDLAVAYQQKGSLRQDLEEAQGHVQRLEALLAEEHKQRELALADKNNVLAEVEVLQKQAADLQRQGAEQKEAFLSSDEFQELLGVKTGTMLMHGFKGAVNSLFSQG